MVLNVQKSQWGNAEEISFTMNLAVRFERIHRLDYPNATYMWSKTPVYSDCHWRERIGRLTSPQHDRWWTVIDDRTGELVRREISPLIPLAIERLLSVAADHSLELSIAQKRYPGRSLPDI